MDTGRAQRRGGQRRPSRHGADVAELHGTFTLSGPNASNYNITTSSDGTRNVGHITAASALSAGDDQVTVSANGVSQNLIIHKAAAGVSYNGMSVVAVACGNAGTVQNAVNSGGNNTVYLLAPNCTYDWSNNHVTLQTNQMLLGAGVDLTNATGSTIIDGGNNDDGSSAIVYNGDKSGGPSAGATGDAVASLYFQNMGTPITLSLQ